MDRPGRSFLPRRLGGVLTIACLALLVVAFLPAGPAEGGTFPGTNGRIAFTTRTTDGPQIWTMNKSGGYQKRLTDPPHDNYHPGYNSHASRITFISILDSGIRQIFAVNANGSLRTQITNGTRNFAYPSFSLDGERVVASGWRDSNYRNLWLVRTDGKGMKRFTNGNFNDIDAEYSPAGDRIAFTRIRPDGSSDVLVKRLNGHAAKQLTRGTGDCYGSSFSPDGSRVLYTRVSGSMNTGRLFSIKIDGSGRQQLTVNPAGTLYDHAVFSPHGDRVAFIREVDNVHTVPDIFTIKFPQGGGMTNLSQGWYWPTDLDWGVG